MADEKPQNAPEEESKKDTVRINLPPGLTGRPSAPSSGPPSAPKPAPPKPPGPPEDEAKKETAVMGMPVTAPKPKKDTSRVQVSAAKPAVPEMPRPTVKLKREEVALPSGSQMAAPVSVPSMAEESGADVGMSVGAMILSLAVLAYLAFAYMS